jgi:putative MATE family efflux protein
MTEQNQQMEGQDLTKGDIRKQLWSVAWPIMLSIFFYTLYNIVDAFWVSKLSPDAIAAVSISQISLFIMVSLSMGITAGSGVLMAMHIGAKDKKEAERVLGQSFLLSALVGVFFTAFSLVFRNELLTLSGATGTIFEPAMEYFVITASGSILLFLMMTVNFAFNAQGDTVSLTKLFAVSTGVNAVLDPIMIFGWAGFPALGIAGAAYATLISQAVFLGWALYTLSRPKMMVRFRMRNLTFVWESVKKVLKIGIPASLTQVINPIGIAALMFIIALGFKEEGAIAFSIGSRVEFFAFLPAIGFGFGAMSLIGQNIGAGNIARAREAFNKALLYGVGASAVFGLLCMIFAVPITRIFTTDPGVTSQALSYIWVVALSYGFMSATMIEASGFQAIGRSWPGFWIFFVRFIVISIPLAYVLTQVFNLPLVAVWIAIATGNLVASAVGYVWITRTFKKIDLNEVPVHAEPPQAA